MAKSLVPNEDPLLPCSY